MTVDKIAGKGAVLPEAHRSIVDKAESGLGTLSDFFDQIDASQTQARKIFDQPNASDFDFLRALVEAPRTRPANAAPKVPSFEHELLPLIPEITQDGAHWKETLNGIEDHYALRREEIAQARLDALAAIDTATDLQVIKAQQQHVRALDIALQRIGHEIERLQAYRHHKLQDE